MARTPSPWFWEERAEWCVTLRGRRQKLGAHPDGFPAPKKNRGKWNVPLPIQQKFHALMAQVKPASAPVTSGFTVAEIFEKFLEWCQKHREGGTYEFHRKRIQSFIDDHPELVCREVGELKPYHVVEWLDKHSGWHGNYRRGIISSLQRSFNWAVKLGYIDRNPILSIEKPPVQRREQAVTPQEWTAIRDRYKEGDVFRELLEFAWETGCRPQEVKAIEARHVQLSAHRVVFPKGEAKGKKRPRFIYLTPTAEAIIERAIAKRPDGLLFVNSKGGPWTGYSMNCRFQRLKKHLGVKYACYSLRHGFATRKLEDGLDHLTVAALMGHSDGTMLARTYSHISDRSDHLREQLTRETRANP